MFNLPMYFNSISILDVDECKYNLSYGVSNYFIKKKEYLNLNIWIKDSLDEKNNRIHFNRNDKDLSYFIGFLHSILDTKKEVDIFKIITLKANKRTIFRANFSKDILTIDIRKDKVYEEDATSENITIKLTIDQIDYLLYGLKLCISNVSRIVDSIVMMKNRAK